MENNIFYSPPYDKEQNRSNTNNNSCGNQGLDLSAQLIKNRESSFFMRVNSNAMAGDGIQKGDLVIVDRSAKAGNGKIVIAVLDGEMLIRRFELNNYKIRLVPSTNQLSPIEINDASSFIIWGVVTYVIRCL